MNINHRLPVIGTTLALLLILLLPCTGSTLAQAESGTWSSADSMHDPRDGHTATLLSNGKLLIAGGCAGENGNNNATGLRIYFDGVSDSSQFGAVTP